VVSSTPQPHFTHGKDPVPIVQEAGWAPGPVWMGGKSRPHWDSIPDCTAHSQSLYRLSYPAHMQHFYLTKNKQCFPAFGHFFIEKEVCRAVLHHFSAFYLIHLLISRSIKQTLFSRLLSTAHYYPNNMIKSLPRTNIS